MDPYYSEDYRVPDRGTLYTCPGCGAPVKSADAGGWCYSCWYDQTLVIPMTRRKVAEALADMLIANVRGSEGAQPLSPAEMYWLSRQTASAALLVLGRELNRAA